MEKADNLRVELSKWLTDFEKAGLKKDFRKKLNELMTLDRKITRAEALKEFLSNEEIAWCGTMLGITNCIEETEISKIIQEKLKQELSRREKKV